MRVVASDDRQPHDTDVGIDAGAVSAGTTLGGTYRVVHELSRGAMGVVYRGEDLGLGRPVAIKVLRSDLASRSRARRSISRRGRHPRVAAPQNLVQVYALGEHAGDVYFVMELVEGQPLSEVLRATLERREWFPTEAVAQIALEIGDALDAMHVLGLIHRDVKPANILLDRERDRAVLVDVGVAVKAGDQRDAAGTPGFAAPESFLEQEGGPTTDVYGARRDAVLLAHRPAAVRLGLRAAGRASPAQRSVGAAVAAPAGTVASGRRRARQGAVARAEEAMGVGVDVRDRARPRARAPERRAQVAAASTTTPASPSRCAPCSRRPPASRRSRRSSRSGRPEVIGRVRAAHLRVLSRILQHHLGESGMAKIDGAAARARARVLRDTGAAVVGRPRATS